MNAEYKRQLALLLFVASVILTAGLGLRDPWPADEPRFALIARDMAETGNWLLPYVGGVVYPDKPPLFFWLVAALYSIFGSIRVALFLPGVIAGLGTLLLVTDFARRLWDERTAIWCGATLLVLFQFPLQMKSGQIDGLLCLWTTLGLYGLGRHLLLGPDWRWYTIGGLACGLGIITKGVGFLPYFILIPYAFAARRGWPVLRLTRRDMRWLLAPAATLLMILAWLLPMLLITSGSSDPDVIAYRDNILLQQTVTRYANSWGHIKPFWYLITNAIPWLWLPVSFLLPWLLPAWRDDLRKKNSRILLLGCWVLLVLLFFSVSPGKRSLYIFPAAPALALIAGFHARRLMDRAGVQRTLVGIPAFLALSIVAVAMYALMNPHELGKWSISVPALLKVSGSLLITGVLMLGTILVTRRHKVILGFPLSMAIFWVGAAVLLAPALDSIRSGSGLMHRVEHQVSPALDIGFVAWPEQFLLQWQRPVTHFGYRRNDDAELADAIAWVSASGRRRLLLPGKLLDSCFAKDKVRHIGAAHRKDWVIADRSALNGSCMTRTAIGPQMVFEYAPPGKGRPAGQSGGQRKRGGVPDPPAAMD